MGCCCSNDSHAEENAAVSTNGTDEEKHCILPNNNSSPAHDLHPKTITDLETQNECNTDNNKNIKKIVKPLDDVKIDDPTVAGVLYLNEEWPIQVVDIDFCVPLSVSRNKSFDISNDLGFVVAVTNNKFLQVIDITNDNLPPINAGLRRGLSIISVCELLLRCK